MNNARGIYYAQFCTLEHENFKGSHGSVIDTIFLYPFLVAWPDISTMEIFMIFISKATQKPNMAVCTNNLFLAGSDLLIQTYAHCTVQGITKI